MYTQMEKQLVTEVIKNKEFNKKVISRNCLLEGVVIDG